VRNLEQRLRALGAEITFPATPELAVAGIVELRRRSRRLVTIGVALAVVSVCFGAVLAASPSARSGLRDLFGIGSVRVIRLNESPSLSEAGRLVPFGRPVSMAEAERAVTFELRVPESIAGKPPSHIYLDRTVGGGLVSFVWCCSPRIVLSELLGDGIGFLQKSVGPATRIEEVSVDGSPGLWVEGADHILRIVDTNGTFRERAVRVRGGVLVWVDRSVTLRLEGEVTRSEALAIARRLR
jgi:hypothetical protein